MSVKITGFSEIPGNAENLERLMAEKEFLVPFLGAGFSMPACSTWATFLENFFQGLEKGEFLLTDEADQYRLMEKNLRETGFEKMADFLVEKSGRRKFEDELKKEFDRELFPEMKKKFHLLHLVFPNLKITTNFDCLIETTVSGSHMKVCYGYQTSELQRMFTHIKKNALLKIHGCIRNISSIVLSSSQYAEI